MWDGIGSGSRRTDNEPAQGGGQSLGPDWPAISSPQLSAISAMGVYCVTGPGSVMTGGALLVTTGFRSLLSASFQELVEHALDRCLRPVRTGIAHVVMLETGVYHRDAGLLRTARHRG